MKLFQVPVGATFVFKDGTGVMYQMLFSQPDGCTYQDVCNVTGNLSGHDIDVRDSSPAFNLECKYAAPLFKGTAK